MDSATKPALNEVQRRYFGDAETLTLEIELLKETYDLVQQAIEANNWDPQEGPLTLLTLGLGYVQGQHLLASDDAERRALAERLTNLESMYAVMKYRAYSYLKDNQVLDLKISGCEAENRALAQLSKRLREEIQVLKTENARLQDGGEAPQNEADHTRAGADIAGQPSRQLHKPAGFWARLRFLVGKTAIHE